MSNKISASITANGALPFCLIITIGSYPQLTELDLRSCPMGSHGEDVVMSQAAKEAIPAVFECKSLAKVAVYNYYDQAKTHGTYEPIVIIKQNGRAPLAVIDAEVLFDMMAG